MKPPSGLPDGMPRDIQGHTVKMCSWDEWTPAMWAAADEFRKPLERDLAEDESGPYFKVFYANDPDWDRIFFFDEADELFHLIINYAHTKDIIESGDLAPLQKLFPKELRP